MTAPQIADAITAQLRRAPRRLSPAVAAQLGTLLDVPAPALIECSSEPGDAA